MRKLSVPAVVAVSVVALLATSASGLAASGTSAPSVVKVTALASGLKYNTKTLRARAGKVKLVFTNLSALHHTVRLEQGEKEFGGTKTIGTGTTSTVVALKKGKYHFYCSVPGHEDAGMSGTLTVS